MQEYYSSKVYPNGETTLGYISPKSKRQEEVNYDRDFKNCNDSYSVFTRDYRGSRTKETEFLSEKLVLEYQSSFLTQSAIGLSSPPNCHNQGTKRRGLRGITSYQRRQIRNGAWLMQKRFGRKRLGFLTVTIPVTAYGTPSPTHIEWHDLVYKFLQEIGREVVRKGGIWCYVGCTEIQQKRWEKYGVVAPHLHIVYVAHSGDYNWYVPANKIRQIWKRILSNWLWKEDDDPDDFDIGAGVDCQLIKQDAGAYLSKYLSKGGCCLESIKESGKEDYIPSCWYHASKALKTAIKLCTFQLSPDLKSAIIEGIDLVGRGVALWIRRVEVEFRGKLRQFGWVLRLAQEFREVTPEFCRNVMLRLGI